MYILSVDGQSELEKDMSHAPHHLLFRCPPERVLPFFLDAGLYVGHQENTLQAFHWSLEIQVAG